MSTNLPDNEQGQEDESCRREDSFRARLNAPISIVVIDEDDERIATGTANLRDLSLRGALITDIRISSGPPLDPTRRYRLKFRLMAGPLAGMEANCEAIRYDEKYQGFGLNLPSGFQLPIT